jgi:hypothetical protein
VLNSTALPSKIHLMMASLSLPCCSWLVCSGVYLQRLQRPLSPSDTFMLESHSPANNYPLYFRQLLSKLYRSHTSSSWHTTNQLDGLFVWPTKL